MTEYKGVYYGPNPYAQGKGEYQDLLGMDHEPPIIVYTPDVEFYTDTESQARAGIDRWIELNGDVGAYRKRADALVFGTYLKLI